jgi:hypothetical protein
MPNKYSVNSTDEFLTLLKSSSYPNNTLLASLDVESLFTNVPVMQTIEIILNYVYRNSNLAPPAIPEKSMKELLILCTTKAPFRNINGDLYLQVDGVMMGSSLGPTFSNYYMADLEERILRSYPENAPLLYARYVDDIFLLVENSNQLVTLKTLFENNSVLKFTYEEEKNNKLHFLDVLINNMNGSISTSVYTKSTSTGDCINYNGICPERYKTATIKTLLHRAYTITDNWTVFHQEVDKIKQRLVNNNFPMCIIDEQVRKFISHMVEPGRGRNKKNKIHLYYESQLCTNYKLEEKQIANIVTKNVIPVNKDDMVQLNVFYKIGKLKNVLIKNNPHKRTAEFNVVYRYTCNEGECNSRHTYIGYTEQTLQERFKQHQSVLKHLREEHNIRKIKPSDILQSVEVLYRGTGKQDLIVMEALYIATMKPTLNGQEEGRDRILKIF